MTTAPNPSPVDGADLCLFYGSYLLRASVLIHALALFIIVFQTRQTQFGVLLFMHWLSEFEDPYLAAVLIEKITVSLYLVAALVIVFKPYWPLLLFIAGYAFLEAYASAANSGFRYSEWSPAAQVLRYGAPLVLLVLVAAPKLEALRTWRLPLAVSLLRVFVAVVFFTHGYLALLESPRFIDLIIGTSGNIFGARLSESAAVVLLKWIAVIDFCVALAVLVYPIPLLVPRSLWAGPCRICPIRRVILPVLMCWLALWGLVTALSRMTTLGLPTGLWQYPELLLRGSHFLGPLALWALFAAMMDRNRECPDSKQVPRSATEVTVL